MGNFAAQLEDKKTPVTSANFIKLVNQKFYDGLIFHRVVKSFVIQGGDPTGTGNGGPGYTIADEFDSMSNVQKTIGMANDGTPNSGGSQFYINLVHNTFLDKKYSVFGKVISNFIVVQNIGKVPVNGADRPLTNVVMDSLRVSAVLPSGILIEADPGFKFSVFPNPVTDQSFVSIYSGKENLTELIVYNQLGECVFNQMIPLGKGLQKFSFSKLNMLSSSPGIYHIILRNENEFLKQKFVIL